MVVLDGKPKQTKPTLFPSPIDDPLQDTHFQRGIKWRRDMMCAIQRERTTGVPDNTILKRLRRGGITLQKATELMNEATELWSEE